MRPSAWLTPALAWAAVIVTASPTTNLATQVRRSADDCVLPSWSVSSASVTYSDDTYVPGKGIFTLTHLLTNVTENIVCDLFFNTACRVVGTPADPMLEYQYQVNLDFGWVVFNKTWSCGEQAAADPKRPTYAVGYAEFTVECPAVETPTMTCKSVNPGPFLVTSEIWVPEPEEPETEEAPE